MLPTPKSYSVWPSVVPVGQRTTLTVTPTERAFLLFENEEYTLTVIHVNSDEEKYMEPKRRRILTSTADGGVVRFELDFSEEGEQLLLFARGEKQLCEFAIYSLREDLYRLRPMRGDLHSHSYRSDGSRDPAALAAYYRQMGYEFLALTDHNRYYPGAELDEAYQGVPLGLLHVQGEEVHAPGSVVHVVHVGGRESVTDFYVHDREGYERCIDEYLTRVPSEIPEQYRVRYAKTMWATDRIHAVGGLAIFAHPYWAPKQSRAYNVCEELAILFLKSGLFDAYELVGGMTQPGINRSVALYNELCAEGLRLPVVGSSDVHSLNGSTFNNCFTLCFTEEDTSDGIIRAVKNGMCVAVEATGEGRTREYRVYGSLRLVNYAHFLLQNFYPELQSITHGEGIAMRAYAMGKAPAALIALSLAQSEKYRLAFFGKEACHLPSEEILSYEERWREVQMNGPTTCGSTTYTDTVTRQI